MAIIAKFTRTLPVPSATISGGFVFMLSAGWFVDADQGAAGSPINGANSIANGGGDMQIFSDTGATTRLPIEVVSFVTGGSPAAQVWVRTPSYTAGDTITIGKDDTQTVQPIVTAPFGRNAAWVDYIAVYHCQDSNYTDSTGNYDLTPTGVAPAIVTAPNGTNGYDFSGLSTLLTSAIPDTIFPLFMSGNFIVTNFNAQYAMGVSGAGGGTDTSLAGYSSGSRLQCQMVNPNVSFQMTPLGGGSIPAEAHFTAALSTSEVVYGGYFEDRIDYDTQSHSQARTYTKLGLGGRIDGSPEYEEVIAIEHRFSKTLTHNADRDSSEYNNQTNPDNFGTSSEYILVGGSGVTVTAATANYNYSGITGTIDLTGEVIVTGQTANYNYTAITASIELGTEIIVTGQTANYNYAGIDGSVELTGLITVTGQTANYDYDGIAADVTLQGSIVITGGTGNYDYNALNGTIILQGPITLNPKNIIRVSRKSNTIRVKRKSNIIRVR